MNTEQLKEVVYKPQSGWEQIQGIFRDLRKDFRQSVSLGYRLAQRNIKARYRQSLLGIFWALLPPLITAGVWIFLNSQKVFQFEGIAVPYPIFVLTGTLMWQLFQESVTLILGNTKTNKSLLTKINFPHEALLYSAFFEIAFSALIKLILLAVALFAFQVVPATTLPVGLFGVLSLILLGVSLALVLAPLATLYRDIGMGIPLLLGFAMYLTPVIYPEPRFTGVGKLLYLNPVSPLLNSTRGWLYGGDVEWYRFMVVFSGSLVLLFIGIIVYKMSMQIIIERIGS